MPLKFSVFYFHNSFDKPHFCELFVYLSLENVVALLRMMISYQHASNIFSSFDACVQMRWWLILLLLKVTSYNKIYIWNKSSLYYSQTLVSTTGIMSVFMILKYLVYLFYQYNQKNSLCVFKNRNNALVNQIFVSFCSRLMTEGISISIWNASEVKDMYANKFV